MVGPVPFPLLIPLLIPLLPLLLAVHSHVTIAEAIPSRGCTIHSPSTGSYFDLNPLDLSAPAHSNLHDGRNESWYAKGHDYPSNFSLNFCGPVVEPIENVDGLPPSDWPNVSAFYTAQDDHRRIYSIGQSNSELVFRGRKLVLNYTGGSPCPDGDHATRPKRSNPSTIIDPDEDSHQPKSIRRKSSLISLVCDRDPSVSSSPSISFLGTLDECVYMFESHSRYFCGGAISSSKPGSLGPGGVFGVIILVALLAYLLAGCAYQRIVMRQRGWRQCPTHGLFVSAWELFQRRDRPLRLRRPWNP